MGEYNLMGNTTIQNQQIQSLLGQGVSQQFIDSNPQFKNGQWIDPQDTPKYLSAWQQSGQGASNSNIPTLNDLAGQKYEFDPSQYLPGIQQTASSIYDPQRAQIDALAQLQTSQTEQARIRTQEDFAKELTAKVESINARGAFFGGGALAQEGDIAKRENYALQDINLQDQAAQAGFLAQQAGLSAAQAEYIQEKLTGAENSAYSRFQDYRNFMLSLTQAQRDIYESDRDFNENVRQFGLEYALEKKRLKQSKSSK